MYDPGSSGVGGWPQPGRDPRQVHTNPLGALGLVEYGGVRIHDGSFVLEAVGGLTDTPETRQTLTDRAQDHGGFISGSFYSPRIVTVEGYTQTEYLDQLWPAMDLLRQAFGLPGAQILREAQFLMPGWTTRRRLLVRPYGPLAVEQLGGSDARKPFRRWQAAIVAPYPLIEGIAEKVVEGLLGGSMTPTNDGNYPAHLRWEVDGPATNPRLLQSGREIHYTGSLIAGQTLVVDTLNRTALINGGNVYRNVTRFDDVTIRYGTTTYTTTGGTSPTRLKFRDTWA